MSCNAKFKEGCLRRIIVDIHIDVIPVGNLLLFLNDEQKRTIPDIWDFWVGGPHLMSSYLSAMQLEDIPMLSTCWWTLASDRLGNSSPSYTQGKCKDFLPLDMDNLQLETK